jgi:TolA-binding protein
MNDHSNDKFNKTKCQGLKIISLILISSITITSVIVGIGVYTWQKVISEQNITVLQNQINQLQKNINQSAVYDQQNQEQNEVISNNEGTLDEIENGNYYLYVQYDYSIKYPKNWYNFPNFSMSDSEKSFSNKNVGYPLEIGPDGIWIAISIRENTEYLSLSEWASRHTHSPQAVVANVKNININGLSAIQQVEDFTKTEGTDGGYSMVTYLAQDKKVYSIRSITYKGATFDEYKNEYNLIVESFKLNH